MCQARQTSFDAFGAFDFGAVNLSTEDGRPERFSGGLLTSAAFEALGVQPIKGRGFRVGDDKAGAEPVILLSYNLWRDRYGSAPDIVGTSIRANGVFRTVIGVMPEKFAFPIREAAWLPLSIDPLATPRGGQGRSYVVIARLKPGVTLSEARAQAATIASQLAADFPATNRGVGADVMPYAKTVLGPEIYALLYTMLGAGIGVLLIACVNVSNLLVARASLRRREVAVRMALGAGRQPGRAAAPDGSPRARHRSAARIGIVMSVFGMRWFTQALSVNPPPFWITFELDYRVMLFVLGLIVLASLFAGALPALHAARVDVGAALKDDSRSSTSARLGRFSSGLVVAELAVSCGLLIAAGLMVKSVVQLKNVQMPFGIENILTARVDLPRDRYPDSRPASASSSGCCPSCRRSPASRRPRCRTACPRPATARSRCRLKGKSYPNRQQIPRSRAKAS